MSVIGSPYLDSFTEAAKVIDTDHAYIHQGILFETCVYATLSAGGIYWISLTTPVNSIYAHFRGYSLSCSADKLRGEFYRSPTITAATGIALVIFNHNDISTNTALVTGLANPTVTNDGDFYGSGVFIGGGTGVGGSSSGAEATQGREKVLKQDTTYGIKITNGSSSNNTFLLTTHWYEESGMGA